MESGKKDNVTTRQLAGGGRCRDIWARGASSGARTGFIAETWARGGLFRAPQVVSAWLRACRVSFRAPTGIPTWLRARGGSFLAPTWDNRISASKSRRPKGVRGGHLREAVPR